MEGKALRLALACAFAGRSASLGKRLRPYVSIEEAFSARNRWWPRESSQCQQRLARFTNTSHPWLADSSSQEWLLIALGDDDYPPLLAQLDDAPGVLFVRGNTGVLHRPQLAMVGARAASAEGIENARRLAAALASRGFVITSGLAAGIDAASHQGALQTGSSVAVMGTGPDRLYPSRHKSLADDLVAKDGALVTEFPPGEKPEPFHFPMRNRIISGLSLGVIVVEAAIKSGSLITARLAMNQGREVFALPGSLRNPLSRGCHNLLREGANWLEGVDDVLSVFGSMQALAQSTEPNLPVDETSHELLGCFMAGINSLDQLQRRSGLLLTDLMNQLTDLELAGRVVKSTGGYQRSG
jgi:DNA processing protein